MRWDALISKKIEAIRFWQGASGGGGGSRQYSEDTAKNIDSEVKRIIEQAIEAVREMLVVRKQALIALTERLIEVESVDADELQEIIDENSPGPLLVPGTDVPARSEFPKASAIDKNENDERNAAH